MSEQDGDKDGMPGNGCSPSPNGDSGVSGFFSGNAMRAFNGRTPPSATHGAVSFYDVFAAPYRDLHDKLAAAWNSVEIRQAIAEADHELQLRLSALSAAGQELERCEAMVKYWRTVRELGAPDRMREKISFAYARYIDEVREIWSRPEMRWIEPRELAAVGESIAWAGYLASLRP